MVTFLLPGFLYAAGAVALGVVALHLLVTQQPKSDILPTVRFFPDVVARSTSVTIRPSDLWLLLLRVLTILLIGAAFARPQLTPEHRAIARVVVVDRSRAVGNPAQLADSARPHLDGAAAVVLFDAEAHEVPPAAAADSLAAFAGRSSGARPRGALSPALIVALRAASRLRERADSLDLVIVSPLAREETDAATPTIRALWPGRATIVRVAAATDPSSAPSRGTPASPRIEWADSGATSTWVPRPRVDTIGAVRAGDAVLVFPFVRRWQRRAAAAAAADSAAATAAGERIFARWSDGEPAGIERTVGAQCVRSLAVGMPTAGDAMLRPEFVRFTDALAAPCGASADFSPLPAEIVTALTGGPRLAPGAAIVPRATQVTPLVPWLLAGALALALLELLVRRRRRGTPPEPLGAEPAAVPRQAA